MHIYFSGIGGTGLSPLANLALDCGYEVSGSDVLPSKNLVDLQNRGVRISTEQTLNEIEAKHQANPIDWIIHTSALPKDHPHLIFAKTNNIKISKRHELINFILKSKNLKLIAVSGTHGKTTVSGMLVWIFKQLQIPISYLVGTNLSFGKSGEFKLGSSHFVYECDEFDRNFLNYEPFLSIIPSLDYDHPDTYKTDKEYAESFVQFFSQSQNVISWSSSNQYLHQVFDKYNLSFEKMLEGKEIYFIQENEPKNQAYFEDNHIINLPGIHNRRNALLAVLAILHYVSSEPNEKVFEAINSFVGTERRFEKLETNLYTDYGHHPTEIKATLQMAKEILKPDQKLILIYQPHQNIRQYQLDIQEGYINCFHSVDMVYWLPTYLSRENELPVLKPLDIITKIQDLSIAEIKLNPDAQSFETDKMIVSKLDQTLAKNIKQHLAAGDLIVCMGAGDIDDWIRIITKKHQ